MTTRLSTRITSATRRALVWILGGCLLLAGGLLPASAASRQEPGNGTAPQAIELTQEELAWLAENHTVRARVSYWPPYMIDHPQPAGISVDYLNAIAKRFGFKVEYVPDTLGWSNSVADLREERNHFDLMLTMTRTPEREQQFALTKEYLTMPWVIYSRDDSPFISGLGDLSGKTIAVEKGYAIANKLKANFQLLEMDRPEDALRAVATAQADAYVGNLGNTSYLIKERGFGNLVVAAPTPFGDQAQGMAVRKDWPALASLIDKGLAAMTADERQAITHKWSAVEIRPQIDYALVWKVVLGATLILLAVTYWSLRMKREISHRQRVEANLRNERERAQRYLDTVQTIMVALDVNGDVTMINRAGCHLLGFEEDELLGRNWFATCLPQPEGAKSAYRAFRQIIDGGVETAEYYENTVRCKDGRERICAWHNAYLRNEHGQIIGTLSSGEDITERKSLDALLAEQTERLRNERNFMDAILNTQAALVLVTDAEGRLLRFNNASTTAAGNNLEIRQANSMLWNLFPEEERTAIQHDVIAKLRDGANIVEHENRWRCQDNSSRLILWRSTALRNEDGRIRHIISTGIDITDQRQAEEAARERLDQVSRLQRLQTANELATMLAHELNQPLTAISMYVATSQKQLEKADGPEGYTRVASTLKLIEQQSLRAGEVIRHLRSFISRGHVEPLPVDLNRVLQGACALITPKMKNLNIKLDLQLDTSLPQVMAVEVHVEQVLLNLLRNALEAIKDAGMDTGTITVKSTLAQEMAQVSVYDTGPGIETEKARKLFSSIESSKKDGLGVGLHISRSLIEAQAGHLWVEPHTPGGRFHFTLPFIDA